MANIVKEQNTCVIRVTFKDDNNATVTPVSGSYRVDDVTGGVVTQVIDNTTFYPATYYYDIVIPATSNAILDSLHDEETRLITVSFIYSGTRQGSDEKEYTLKNMRRVETLLSIAVLGGIG